LRDRDRDHQPAGTIGRERVTGGGGGPPRGRYPEQLLDHARLATHGVSRNRQRVARMRAAHCAMEMMAGKAPAVKPVCPARHIRHSSAIRIEKTARHQPAG